MLPNCSHYIVQTTHLVRDKNCENPVEHKEHGRSPLWLNNNLLGLVDTLTTFAFCEIVTRPQLWQPVAGRFYFVFATLQKPFAGNFIVLTSSTDLSEVFIFTLLEVCCRYLPMSSFACFKCLKDVSRVKLSSALTKVTYFYTLLNYMKAFSLTCYCIHLVTSNIFFIIRSVCDNLFTQCETFF